MHPRGMEMKCFLTQALGRGPHLTDRVFHSQRIFIFHPKIAQRIFPVASDQKEFPGPIPIQHPMYFDLISSK